MKDETQLQAAQSILDEFRPGLIAKGVTIGPDVLTATIHTDQGDVKVTGLFASQLARAKEG